MISKESQVRKSDAETMLSLSCIYENILHSHNFHIRTHTHPLTSKNYIFRFLGPQCVYLQKNLRLKNLTQKQYFLNLVFTQLFWVYITFTFILIHTDQPLKTIFSDFWDLWDLTAGNYKIILGSKIWQINNTSSIVYLRNYFVYAQLSHSHSHTPSDL